MPAEKTPEKPLRKDAARNRELLVSAAARLLATEGPDVALELIASEAGVGIGTLYRNFPDRTALIEAAYRSEVEQLCEAAGELVASEAPVEAMTDWSELFIEFAPRKRGIVTAFQSSSGKDAVPFPSQQLITEAVDSLLKAGIESGDFRDDLTALDVLQAMAIVWSIPEGDDWERSARTQMRLLLDGLRYRGASD